MELDNIYLGDSYELIKEIPDESVDLIVTDPPYEFGSVGCGGICKDRKYIKEIFYGAMDYGIKSNIFDEYVRVMKKINIYIWCNKEQIMQYMKYFVEEKGCNFEIIIWGKDNPAPFCSTHYLKDKEYCLYFWETGATLNVDYDKGKTVYLTKTNIVDKSLYLHPTIKPLEIVKNMILNSSNEGDIVLDTFMGSGTTAVACKQLNRHFIGFEINEKYWNIANDRVKGITQLDRKIERTGQMSLF